MVQAIHASRTNKRRCALVQPGAFVVGCIGIVLVELQARRVTGKRIVAIIVQRFGNCHRSQLVEIERILPNRLDAVPNLHRSQLVAEERIFSN